MYYDLIASLPHLPHFERAEWLPITRLRLDQRLRLLRPAHAQQLTLTQSLIGWRTDRQRWQSDSTQVKDCASFMEAPLKSSLKEYAVFRIDQQTLMAALRRRRAGLAPAEAAMAWGVGPWFRYVQRHWDEPDFRLGNLFQWLPQAGELLAAGDARGLERLLMDVAWRRLDRCAEQNMFGFEAVSAYFFKWDILRAWLASDPEKGKTRFRELIDQVTHVEYS